LERRRLRAIEKMIAKLERTADNLQTKFNELQAAIQELKI
jgi:chaperonin cofactor prefoldin